MFFWSDILLCAEQHIGSPFQFDAFLIIIISAFPVIDAFDQIHIKQAVVVALKLILFID